MRILPYVWALAAMLLAIRRLSKNRAMRDRFTGKQPLFPPSGPMRWIPIAGGAMTVGIVTQAVVSKSLGYLVIACAAVLFVTAELHIAANRNGAAEDAVRAFGVDERMSTRAALRQTRVFGVMGAVMGSVVSIAFLVAAIG
jgi:hypothetical protein